MQNFEKLGIFYLGKEYDFKKDTLKKDPLLLDDSQLTTHAVILGMTGSGKTGLGITILEEAAIDGIPALIIDPKGDLGNLLLTFPKLESKDFLPWIDKTRTGQTPEKEAEAIAEKWKKGLKEWDEDGDRILRLQNAVETVIYTPASQAGIPLSIMSSFDAPPKEVALDPHLFRDMILSTVTSLLVLIGIQGDPLKSREHILLSTIFEHEWAQGRSLDLPAIIHFIQKPPFDKVGVFDLETFYPAKDRNELAISVNNLLASPSFKSWIEGEPLDIQRLFYTEDGKPRHAILSIAHLQDAERMFFLTILLNRLISWMRIQPGTSSLRALLYMDEIFGFFPPVAMPPSKGPMLTLLKQARAYGLGIILATQNPGDIDYKALANCGLWFIGKLQTDRDRSKVLEGLKISRPNMEKTVLEKLSQTRNRLFMLQSIYEEEPLFFETRWPLSYLKGPLTLPQISELMESKKENEKSNEQKVVALPNSKPILPPKIEEYYLRTNLDTKNAVWIPMALGRAQLHFANAKYKIDTWNSYVLAAAFLENGIDWIQAEEISEVVSHLDKTAPLSAIYANVPESISNAKAWEKWEKEFNSYLYQEKAIEVYEVPSLKLQSNPKETEGDFRVRISVALREDRDKKIQAIRESYEAKIEAVKEKIRKCEMKLAKEQGEMGTQKISTAISFGETLLGMLLGKKLGTTTISKAGTSMRNAQKIGKKQQDVTNVEEEMQVCNQKLAELENSLQQEISSLQSQQDPGKIPIEKTTIYSKKGDNQIIPLALLWYPKLG